MPEVESVPLGEQLKKRLPQTTSLYQLLVIGVAFLALSLPVIFSNNQLNNSSPKWATYFLVTLAIIGLILLVLWLGVFIIELLSILFFPVLTGFLYKVRNKIYNRAVIPLKKAYIYLLMFFFKPVIKQYLKDERDKRQTKYFNFTPQETDLHVYPAIMNLGVNNVEVTVMPATGNAWCIGFRFATDKRTLSTPSFYNCIYISRNNEDKIRVTHLDSRGVAVEAETIMSPYRNDPFIFRLNYKAGMSKVVIQNDEGTDLIAIEVGNMRYCKLGSWNPSRNSESYILNTRIVKAEK